MQSKMYMLNIVFFLYTSHSSKIVNNNQYLLPAIFFTSDFVIKQVFY